MFTDKNEFQNTLNSHIRYVKFWIRKTHQSFIYINQSLDQHYGNVLAFISSMLSISLNKSLKSRHSE